MSGFANDSFQVTSISGGKDQTLALLKSGEILGWGGAGSGRITPPFVDICSSFKAADAKPVFVGKLSRCSAVSAGFGVSLVVSDQGQTLVLVARINFLRSPRSSKVFPIHLRLQRDNFYMPQ